MNWAETVKATALATLAEREETTARRRVTMPSSWTTHDVWLKRVKPPRDGVTMSSRPSVSDPSTPPR